MTTASTTARLWYRWSRRVVVALLGLELLYVAAFEIAVRSGRLERWVNRRPEKAAIAFAGAHSWFPFQVSVRGFDLRVQTPRLRWRLQVDAGRFRLSPLALLGRRMRFASLEARGIDFLLRHEHPGQVLDERAEALLPQIAALAPLPSRARPPRPKWSFEFPRVGAAGVREVWVDQLRLTGEIAAKGGGAFHRGVESEVFASGLDLTDGRLSLGRFEVANQLRGRVEAEVARWPYKEKRGLAALPFVSGKAVLEGHLTIGSFLRGELLPEWFRFAHQPAPFSAHLDLRAGLLQPGTRIEMQPTDCELGLYEFTATGRALAHLEVTSDASGPRGDVEVRFRDFEVRQAADSRAEIVGTGLSLVATTRDLGLHGPPFVAAVRFDLGEARLADLALYDRLIPKSLPLAILGGSGTVRGRLDAALPELTARGAFRARVENAAVRYGELDLAGTVDVDLALASAGLASRSFDLSGTRLELTDFRSPQAQAAGPRGDPGWWARFDLPEGRLRLPPATEASGRFVARLRDSVPLVGLFATRRDLPGWAERVLSVEDLRAVGRLRWEPSGFTLEEFSTRLRDSKIRARLRFGRSRRAGAMMIEWWKLALGMRLDDDRKQLKLTRVRDWFAAQSLGAPPAAAAASEDDEAETGESPALDAADLAGTRWRLEAVEPPGAAVAELSLSLGFAADAVTLESVCGSARAVYAIEPGARLKIAPFPPFASSCSEGLAAEESRLRRALETAGVLSMTPAQLVLAGGEGESATQLLFTAVSPP